MFSFTRCSYLRVFVFSDEHLEHTRAVDSRDDAVCIAGPSRDSSDDFVVGAPAPEITSAS